MKKMKLLNLVSSAEDIINYSSAEEIQNSSEVWELFKYLESNNLFDSKYFSDIEISEKEAMDEIHSYEDKYWLPDDPWFSYQYINDSLEVSQAYSLLECAERVLNNMNS